MILKKKTIVNAKIDKKKNENLELLCSDCLDDFNP